MAEKVPVNTVAGEGDVNSGAGKDAILVSDIPIVGEDSVDGSVRDLGNESQIGLGPNVVGTQGQTAASSAGGFNNW